MLNKKRILLAFDKTRIKLQVVSQLSEYYDVAGCLLLSDQPVNDLGDSKVPIVTSSNITNFDYDSVLLCSGQLDRKELANKIKMLGVSESKIDFSYLDHMEISRDNFLAKYSDECRKNNIQGFCAECGVYKGAFAKRINKYFFERNLYLFDYFDDISNQDLLTLMPHPEKCCFFKGDFCSTSDDLSSNDYFCYVHMDFNAYVPTKRALEVFTPRMVSRGIIAVHDYFNTHGETRKAVDEFLINHPELYSIPLAGGSSIAIIGF